MRGPSIDFERVSLTLGNTSILRDVSFSIRAGTLHCIVGANGGGKTSLVRALLGQMPHTGCINIHWHDCKLIGYVPQALDFDKNLPITVLDFMALTSQRRPVFFGVSRARRTAIEEMLARLGLAGQLKKPLGGLSGGERQRVLLAQALLPEPSLLVLDEPMAGLDLAGRDVVERTIRQFVKDGGTAVWINHDIVQVNAIADSLTYIDCTVLLDGAPQFVLSCGAAAQLFPTLTLPASEAARP